MLCLKVLRLNVQADAAGNPNLGAAANCISALQLSAIYLCPVARELRSGIVEAAQALHEGPKAASGNKGNSRSNQRGVVLNLSRSAVSSKLNRIRRGIAAGELARHSQPGVEVRGPGALPTEGTQIAGASRVRGADELRISERDIARQIKTRPLLREHSTAEHGRRKHGQMNTIFHVVSS